MPKEGISVEIERKESFSKKAIRQFFRFGRELKISPKASATLNEPGFKVEYFTQTVSVLIGIGKDHTAELIMTKEAHDAFIKGEEISITTVGEFQERFVNKKAK